MADEKAPRPPRGLGPAGRLLWRRFFAEVAAGDPDDLAVLTEACAQRDVVARIQEALVDADLLVRGSNGQDIANPLLVELRHHRKLLADLLRRLDLDEEGPAESRSAAGRALVRQRWG